MVGKTIVVAFAFMVAVTFGALVAACAESQPAAPPPAAGTPGARRSHLRARTTQLAWDAMSKDQRKAYMKAVVMPKMKETFVAFAADHYAEMNCATCHGDGATDGTFKMPNPKLPALPTTPDGFKKLMGDKAQVTQFMATKVKPQMARCSAWKSSRPSTSPASAATNAIRNCGTLTGSRAPRDEVGRAELSDLTRSPKHGNTRAVPSARLDWTPAENALAAVSRAAAARGPASRRPRRTRRASGFPIQRLRSPRRWRARRSRSTNRRRWGCRRPARRWRPTTHAPARRHSGAWC